MYVCVLLIYIYLMSIFIAHHLVSCESLVSVPVGFLFIFYGNFYCLNYVWLYSSSTLYSINTTTTTASRFVGMVNDLTFFYFFGGVHDGYFLTLLGVDESGCRVLPTEDGATFPFCSSSLLFALRQTLSRLAC